jgi:hypothetical protein
MISRSSDMKSGSTTATDTYESRSCSYAMHSQNSTPSKIPIYFRVEKTSVPSISFTTDSSSKLNSVTATNITVHGFTLTIDQSENGLVQWRGTWTAEV